MSGKSKEMLENLTHEVSQLNNYFLNLDIYNCDISFPKILPVFVTVKLTLPASTSISEYSNVV